MLYAIVDKNLNIARHLSKGKLAVFKNLNQLNKNAWRYMYAAEEYKVAELEVKHLFDLENKK